MFTIIIKSIIVGALAGAGAAGGAARMFHAPEIQGMGAFRTLGEMNACEGDPIAHLTYGMGFFFSSAGTAVGTGSFEQDVLHRIVPNWAAAASITATKDDRGHTNPAYMALFGAGIGAAVVTFLNTIANIIPDVMSLIAENVISPAADLLMKPVMPVAFWLAALNAGKEQGTFATIFGVLAQYIMGNATPGCVLGILIGQSVADNGIKDKVSVTMLIFVSVMFLLIAYFRDLLPI